MQSPELMDLLNEIEQSWPVSEWTVGEVHVWPLVRSQIWWRSHTAYAQLRKDGLADRPVKRRLRQLRGRSVEVARYARSQVVDRSHCDTTSRQAEILLFGDGYSRVRIGSAWYDRICDPIIELAMGIGLNPLMIERNHVYRAPRANASVYIQPRVDLWWAESRLRSRSELPFLPDRVAVQACLADRRLSTTPVAEETIQRLAGTIQIYSDHFTALLRRVRPKLAFGIDHNLVSMGFNLACRRSGVVSVDVQHGVQGRLHWAYGRWTSLPDQGYALLPAVYWTWTDLEVRTIEEWAAGHHVWHRPVVGGNVFLESWTSGRQPLIDHYDIVITERKRRAPGTLDVLVTLQNGVSGPRYISDLIEVARTNAAGWRWWFRLHPAMEEPEAQRCRSVVEGLGAHVLLDDGFELPLYALLRRVDLHATYSSTTVIEAGAFGVPSVVTTPAARDLYPTEVESGWAVQAQSAPAILAALQGQLDRRESLVPVTTQAPDPEATLQDLLASSV